MQRWAGNQFDQGERREDFGERLLGTIHYCIDFETHSFISKISRLLTINLSEDCCGVQFPTCVQTSSKSLLVCDVFWEEPESVRTKTYRMGLLELTVVILWGDGCPACVPGSTENDALEKKTDREGTELKSNLKWNSGGKMFWKCHN